jgi:hypothetical protein
VWKSSRKSTDIWRGRGSHQRNAFRRIPLKSICAASNQLQTPRSTVHDVLHKSLQQLTRCNWFKPWNRMTYGNPQYASKHVDRISSVPWGVPTLQSTKVSVVAVRKITSKVLFFNGGNRTSVNEHISGHNVFGICIIWTFCILYVLIFKIPGHNNFVPTYSGPVGKTL